jgi:hypothetical protein
MPLCLSEAAANTRGRLCLRPSISGRCACTVPAPCPRHGRVVAAPTTPRPQCARTGWQRPSYRGRCRRHACAAPRPCYPLILPQRHLTESAAPTTPRPRNCPHGMAEAAYLTAAAAGTQWPRHARGMPARFRLCCCYCSED